MLSLTLDKKAEKLRQDFRLWLKDHRPPQINPKNLDEFVKVSSEWQAKLALERWVAVHWPENYGGRGLTLIEEALIQELLAEAGSPQLINLFGLTMVGPVLIKHGTAEMKQRFLKPILSAEEIWCQGFSETQAGSDLAAVRTSAARVPNASPSEWAITGSKVWTSFAQYASFCFLLARTDASVPKHEGLSYFLVPMRQPGIQIRPLVQISGDSEFNEVFFEGAKAEDKYLVGKPGEGWGIAISTLMFERVVLTFARHLQSEAALKELKAVVSAGGGSEDQLVQIGKIVAKSMAVRTLALSHLMQYSAGKAPGPEGSMDKLFWSETFQEICKLCVSVHGTRAVFASAPDSEDDGAAVHRYLYSRGRTIAAGTSEIQRNIIAERVLGLPRAK